MLNPKFTEDAFKRNQKQVLESFKQAKSQPATVASDVIAKINYGPNNILSMSEDGTEYTVKNLKLDDIENYYNNS
jgi:zinc protease